MDDMNYTQQLSQLIAQKTEWYNGTEFPQILDKYRLLYTCVKNINDMLIQKSIIAEDPYRFEKKISEVICPDTNPYNETERNVIVGTRFSDYIAMLDFICTYTRFNIETITLSKIKKFQELNACFDWDELTSNSAKPNTRGLSILINEARTNSPSIVQSMLNDHLSKCSQTLTEINKRLNQLIRFQREIYKLSIRKDLQEHPSYNMAKALESPDAELAEIKRVFPEIMGKKPFYTELINEIIYEDQGPDREANRQSVLSKLEIKETKKVTKKQVNTKELLMNSVLVLGALSPTYRSISEKISENLSLVHTGPSSLAGKIKELFRKAFGLKAKEIQIKLVTIDPITKHKNTREIKVNELIEDINRKDRIYTGIANRGIEYNKINAANEDQILSFLGKQISENQNLFITIQALDDYFKNIPNVTVRVRMKGMKIDLDTMKNTIITCNKKRGEYQAVIEEAEQMKRLGIKND